MNGKWNDRVRALRPRRTKRTRAIQDRLESLETRALMTASLLRDINTQILTPTNLRTDGQAAFFLLDGSDGVPDLWKSDGTAGGTRMVKNFTEGYGTNAPPSFSAYSSAVVANNAIYHVTNSGGFPGANSLTRIDGDTGAIANVMPLSSFYGTQVASAPGGRIYVADGQALRAYDPSTGVVTGLKTFPNGITLGPVLGDRLYFSADDGQGHGEELWSSDGTASGTVEVVDLNGASSSNPSYLTILDGALYFRANDDFAFNLYKADPSGVGATLAVPDVGYDDLIPFAGKLVGVEFSYTTYTYNLVAVDPAAGTSAILASPADGMSFSAPVVAGGRMYFVARPSYGDGPWELWSSLGTPETTSVVTALPPLFGGSATPYSSPQLLRAVGDRVVFFAWSGATGVEPWSSDGTAAGTAPILDLNPGIFGSSPGSPTLVGDKLVFVAHSDQSGDGLYVTDGTAAGTGPVKTFAAVTTASSDGYYGSRQTWTIGGVTYFMATDVDHGRELWRTDGTAAGTALVADFVPGPGDSDATSVFAFGAATYVVANQALYRIDPATGGVTTVFDAEAIETAPVVVGGRIAFLATDSLGAAASYDSSLWASDGTAVGTTRVATLTSGYYSYLPYASRLAVADGRVYFASWGESGAELWSSDLTAGGTAPIADLPAFQDLDAGSLISLGGTLYFTADDGTTGLELWRTDGTAAGTALVADLNPDGAARIDNLTVVGGDLYFTADDGTLGPQVYRRDGSTGAVALVKDLGKDAFSFGAGPRNLTAVGDKLYFTFSRNYSDSLYVTGGTEASTILLASSGFFGSVQSLATDAGIFVYDPMTSAVNRSDGTAGGATRFSGVPSGGYFGRFLGVTPNGGVIAMVDDGIHGLEPTLLTQSPPNSAPSLSSPGNTFSVTPGQVFTHQFVASDPDAGQVLTYRLSYPVAGVTIDAATGLFTWTVPDDVINGYVSIQVYVSDDGDPVGTASASLNFLVTGSTVNQAPYIYSIGEQEIDAGDTLSLMAYAYDPDPGQTITYSISAPGLSGATINPSTGALSLTPGAGVSGLFDVTVTATDNGTPPRSGSQTFRVEVIAPGGNHKPTIGSIPSQSVTPGSTLSFTVPGSDRDAGQTLTYSLFAAPTGVTIDASTGVVTWDVPSGEPFGFHGIQVQVTDNGTPQKSASAYVSVNVSSGVANRNPTLDAIPDQSVAVGETLTLTAHATDPDVGQVLFYSLFADAKLGATINSATGAIRIAPTTGATGPYTVSVSVNDGYFPFPGFDSKSFVVTIAESGTNNAPVLAAIAPQTVTAGSTLTVTASATDPDAGQAITYAISAPAALAATINPATGAITFAPAAGATPGVYAVTVTATDNGTPAKSDSKAFQVTVAAANNAPVLAAIAPQTVTAGSTLTFTASATDPDAGQAITYSLTGAPAGASIGATSGAFSWTVPSDFAAGPYTFTVTATDNGSPAKAASRTVSVTVAAANNAPVLAAIAPQTVTAGSTLTVTASATDPDAGQAITYAISAPAALAATINPATGAITFAPAAAASAGVLSVTVTATDNGTPAKSDSKTFQVTVAAAPVNRSPVLGAIASQSVKVGTTLTVTASATDPDAGQTLTYGVSAPAAVGATIDPATGVITLSPAADAAPGVYVVNVTATDNGLPLPLTGFGLFSVTVFRTEPNRAPTVAPIAARTVTAGTTLAFTASATDPDAGQSLAFGLANAPSGATIDPATGAFSWAVPANLAAGLYSFSVTVQDDGSPRLSGVQVVTVTVVTPNRKPALPPVGEQVLAAAEGLTLNLAATDPDAGQAITYSVSAPGLPGAAIDPATGVFRYTPVAGVVGAFDVTVTATDNGSPALSDTKTFRVVVKPPISSASPGAFGFSAASYTVDEAGGSILVTVVRVGGTDGAVTVNYATADGTAAAGTSYAATSGTLSFAAGEGSRTFSIPILDDALFGMDRTVNLVLSAPGGGATLGAQSSAVLTIRNNDPTPPLLTVPSVTLQASKKKDVGGLTVSLGGDVDEASAENVGNYQLFQVTFKGKKQISRAVPIASASFDKGTGSVKLKPRKALKKGAAFKLVISGTSLKDAHGMALDGNADGKPGGDFAIALGKGAGKVKLAGFAVDAALASLRVGRPRTS